MPNPATKKRRKLIIFAAIALVLIGLTVAAILRRREPVLTIQTEPVKRRDLTELVVANGRIQPVLQVKISAEVSGEIIELPVKEGQAVRKGDLLVRIKPDVYEANLRSAKAGFMSSEAGKELAEATLKKAELEFARNEKLFRENLVSETVFQEFRTAAEIARAQHTSAIHQVDVARASLARAEEELKKTTIYSPITGTVSKLNSELGERVVGTAMMTGTEIMIVADLNEMEAQVDIGEIDIVLIALGQKARLEVDAFRDRKFSGVVSEIANSSRGAAAGGQIAASASQEATKFEVKIRVNEKEPFRPGMSVTAEVETRYRSNVLAVPIQSVTTRLPKGAKEAKAKTGPKEEEPASGGYREGPDRPGAPKKADDAPKPIEVVFLLEGEQVRMVPVKRGISDDSYSEITDGVTEGQEVVSGGYKAISRELEDGKKVKKGKPEAAKPKETQ